MISFSLDRHTVLKAAFARGLTSDENPSLIFHDLEYVTDRLNELHFVFPSGSLHAVAIKANPLVAVLKTVVQQGGGLEAASLEEVYLAQAAGCPSERIIYDSPAKTDSDLESAIRMGVYINADNFQELDRIAVIQKKLNASIRVGIRVNPLVGTGKIAASSVSHRSSKFGIPLDQCESKLIEYFGSYPWLVGVHIHVGSQGYELSRLVDGIRVGYHLIQRVESRLGAGRIEYFDIGGGVPVGYRPGELQPNLRDYAEILQSEIPGLFQSSFRIITEFGRSVHAKAGWAVSRVEYVKDVEDFPLRHKVAVVHLGADFLLRRAYQPQDWHHEILVCNSQGIVKKLPSVSSSRWTIAGPLCFGGDILAENRELPEIEPGDWVIVLDVGAYTLGMWSRYCSRRIPAVVGYRSSSPEEFEILRSEEKIQDIVSFWS